MDNVLDLPTVSKGNANDFLIEGAESIPLYTIDQKLLAKLIMQVAKLTVAVEAIERAR